VRLEGLGKLKKFNDLIGNRTRDLPACGIVPQPTTLPRGALRQRQIHAASSGTAEYTPFLHLNIRMSSDVGMPMTIRITFSWSRVSHISRRLCGRIVRRKSKQKYFLSGRFSDITDPKQSQNQSHVPLRFVAFQGPMEKRHKNHEQNIETKVRTSGMGQILAQLLE
jgi:hypothetical protein